MVGVEGVAAGTPFVENESELPLVGDRNRHLTSFGSAGHPSATSSMGRRKVKSFISPNSTSSSDAAKHSTTMHVDGEDDNESMAVEGPVAAEGSLTVVAPHVSEPTSSDYYFDSYAHFGELELYVLIPSCYQDEGGT